MLNGFERPPDSVNTGLNRDICDILIIGDVNAACVQYKKKSFYEIKTVPAKTDAKCVAIAKLNTPNETAVIG